MAKSKCCNSKRMSYIAVPSQIINSLSSSSLQSLLLSPKKSSRTYSWFLSFKSPRLWFLILFLFGLLGMLKLGYNLDPMIPFAPYPCSTTTQTQDLISNGYPKSEVGFASMSGIGGQNAEKDEVLDGTNQPRPLISNGFSKSEVGNVTGGENDEEQVEDSEFWKQPDGLGYKPCLVFSREYRRASDGIVKDRTRYLMVVVSGGMNQQRNQIVDAVVIARILGAALVVPILQVNVIWGDESEFSDIFDIEHFKRVLANDVRIVSALPSTHLMTRPVEGSPPLHVSPKWIRARYLKRLNREGVLLLRGLDSRLSKDLPSDLQKLRCKVAFHALRFTPPILQLGNKLAERMRTNGPYLALHLRMEKDVWIRTGCLPGLSHEYDEIVNNERKQRPDLLTARSNMTYHDRKLAGLCPLNGLEVARLLKALGAPKTARIYWAGGQPLGGKEALLPLTQEFPQLYNKEDLALPGELEPLKNRASLMAAIDYIVSENSDVFMPSHGGNMGHAIQGHRAYAGHKKYITPNKRKMLPYFLKSTLSESEFNSIIKELHGDSLGQPELRTNKAERDVTKYPVPECMCNDSHTHSYL
ncbi:O-fucosyltransferase 20 [Juglans microcarpa x Juglans regia]|uniref:O-fucosyltransferase 20 n=1 Tax=Juglans microcarpa x Juglans regia TaxID=2249226 RepID=UPI001B7E828A|nr:O-fucosyltransferase 20 [Juglans microcarpa x Juglans regia]